MGLLGDFLNSITALQARRASDYTMRQNADNAENVGLEVRVTRTYDGAGLSKGRKCNWCIERCGANMTLQEAYRKGAFQRHPGCGCEIAYTNSKGITRTQSWSGGRESWFLEEDIRRRKAFGIEPSEGPARHELVKRMIEGQNKPDNQGIIAEKILKKEYSLRQRHQKYLQHIEGTPQYKSAVKGRGRNQSVLFVSEEEAQDIIYNCAGLGDIDIDANGDIRPLEFITLDNVIGKYFAKGEWHETRRVQIIYSKYGTHIVPVREK